MEDFESTDGHRAYDQDVLKEVIQMLKAKKISPEACLDRYRGLIWCREEDTSKIDLNPRYNYLLFDEARPIGLSDSDIQLICRDEVKTLRGEYQKRIRSSDRILDRDGFQLDLSRVDPQYSFPDIDLLSNKRGVLVPRYRSFIRGQTINPAVNVAIAVSHWGARRKSGRMLWQQKRTHVREGENWHMVPDLLYEDYKWDETGQQALRFLTADFHDQCEFLNADLGLRDDEIVMPCSLDCQGSALNDPQDVRVMMNYDGLVTASPVTISIPSGAYIGWSLDMIPREDDLKGRKKFFVAASMGGQTHIAQYKVNPEKLEALQVRTVEQLYDRLASMYSMPKAGAIVYYRQIREAKDKAMKDSGEKPKDLRKQ